MTIAAQDKTPGQHAAWPGPEDEKVAGTLATEPSILETLKSRHAQFQQAVQDWLTTNLVCAPFDPALGEFEVKVDVEPDLTTEPDGDAFDRAEQVAFVEHRWWFVKPIVEIWAVPNQGSDLTNTKDPLRVARAELGGYAEGETAGGFVAAWEGTYPWMELLTRAVDQANDLLTLLKSSYRLTVEPNDPEHPTPQPTLGSGSAPS